MLITHPSLLLKSLYPSLKWNIETGEKNLYLTFDDGPTAGVTDVLLDLLKNFNAKASFFCIGKNIQENPELFQRVIDEGHEIGNHTYQHLNGWKSKTIDYLRDVKEFEHIYKSNFFRPPYGRLKPGQIAALKDKYQIMMWSALSMDYHPRVSKEDCYEKAVKQLKPGNIILFHDSIKAKEKMLFAVEKLLKKASEEGYAFQSLSN